MVNANGTNQDLANNDVNHVNSNDFEITLNELKDLMQSKSSEAQQKILDKYGSMDLFVKSLHTDTQNGIPGTQEDISKRVKRFGRNEIPPKPPKSIFVLALEAVEDPTLIMLIICSIISIGLSFYHPSGSVSEEDVRENTAEEANLEWIEGTAIMVAVAVVVSVTAFNDWRKERQFRSLKDKIENGF